MEPAEPLFNPERARRLRAGALALVVLVGAISGALVLAIEPLSDFLAEGAVRVVGLDGGARRVLIGVGLIAATAVTATALAQRHTPARAVLALAGVLVALFLGGPLALPLAAAVARAVGVERGAGLTRAQLERATPRRQPAAWLVGGVLGAIVVLAAGWVGWQLTAPLFDEGRRLDEKLAFAVSSPVAGAASGGAVAPPSTGAATAATATASAGAAATGTVVAAGELTGADSFHTGSGRVLIISAPDGAGVLRFEDYAVRNGPDLRIYLTPDPDGDVFVDGALDLGAIKATQGNVNYDLPAGVDLAAFRTAVVYCYGFRVTFATAALR